MPSSFSDQLHIRLQLTDMFAARPVSKRAARIAHTFPVCYAPARMVGGARSASTGIPTKKPAHRVAGGQNSMLVGTAVLGATLLVGYAFGRGETVEKAAHKTLGECPPTRYLQLCWFDRFIDE